MYIIMCRILSKTKIIYCVNKISFILTTYVHVEKARVGRL